MKPKPITRQAYQDRCSAFRAEKDKLLAHMNLVELQHGIDSPEADEAYGAWNLLRAVQKKWAREHIVTDAAVEPVIRCGPATSKTQLILGKTNETQTRLKRKRSPDFLSLTWTIKDMMRITPKLLKRLCAATPIWPKGEEDWMRCAVKDALNEVREQFL